MTATTGGPNSLKEYLKRYESNNTEEEKKKKKKKKKKKNPEASKGTGILVVDEDPVWQKPVNLDEEDDESADEAKPEVEEDIEVKRMKRLEQLRLRRPYNAIAEDGSGWVTIDSTVESNNPTSDMSPPRKPRTRNDTPSPESFPRQTSGENAYMSPPRKQWSRHDSPSTDPDLRPPHSPGLDPDLSLPRKRRARYDTSSPKHEVKPRKEDPDLSPPRQRRRRYDTPSPEPVKRSGLSTGLDSDLSPPRKHISRHDMLSPIGKHVRKDTDLSPPRQRQRHYDSSPEHVKKPGRSVRLDSDLSPPRKHRARNYTASPGPEVKPAREDTDLSPPRQQRRHVSQEIRKKTSDMDLSPPRKNKEVGSFRPSHRSSTENGASGVSLVPDLSPPRRSQKEGSSIPAYSKRQPRTGLISGKDISEEVHNIKNADLLRFQEMDPSITGRGAEPVYRDKKKGGRISKDEYLKSKQKIDEKPKEKKLEWVQGLAQKREAEARLQELELEKEKPFARTRDDPELDKMLKERVRWGDPMAHLVKKKHSGPALLDLAADEKMKESGFVIPQDIPNHSWLKRGLDAAPNRYGIRPGRHWDGVDRSNGYEKQMFTRMNEKRATEKEAYLWSVSDM